MNHLSCIYDPHLHPCGVSWLPMRFTLPEYDVNTAFPTGCGGCVCFVRSQPGMQLFQSCHGGLLRWCHVVLMPAFRWNPPCTSNGLCVHILLEKGMG